MILSLLFICTAIFIGILVVLLTSKNPKSVFHLLSDRVLSNPNLSLFFLNLVKKCQLNFLQQTSKLLEYSYGPRSIAAGHFNNDTQLDVVVANEIHNSITIYLGNDDGIITKKMIYSTGAYSRPYMVAVADFNKDSFIDIAVANFDSNSISIFLGYGNGLFSNPLITSTHSSRSISLHIIDLDNDTFLDIITANHGAHNITLLFGYGNGTFSHPIMYSTGYDSLSYSVTTGDFDQDHHLDIAVANYGTDNIGIFLANGDRTFIQQVVYSTDVRSHPHTVIVGHFNDDTKLDIAVANHGSNSIGIFLGHGNGTVTSQINLSLDDSSPYSIGIGRFNTDDRLDLVVTCKGTNNIAVLYAKGDGTFSTPIMYSTGSLSTTSVAVGQFNRDNRLDIAVANNDTNSVGILLGVDGGLLNATTFKTESWLKSVVLTDLNKDNRLDIIVTNNWNRSIQCSSGIWKWLFWRCFDVFSRFETRICCCSRF